MESMALSALIKQYGAELIERHLSEVEIVDGYVSRVVETFIIDMVVLAFGRHVGTKVHITTIQLVSEVASEVAFDEGAEEAEVEAMDIDVPAATTSHLLPDGTIWFTDQEEGQNVYWCIHNPDHPLLPGHAAARLA
jgi:hypothetical protein